VEELSGVWRLMAFSTMGASPAGFRLLKSEPWPVDQFVFDTREEAIKAAEKLAKYLGTTTNTKSK